MVAHSLTALVGSLSLASATSMGFNWASNGQDQGSFEADFKAQASLKGASGFNSARLYTMIQDGTTNTPISAIPAAISTKTTLLLGLWASAGQSAFDNELAALKSAIRQYGSDFADAVVGISVGSEDLYRDTDTSRITNKDPNPGASPDTLADYIGQVRDVIKGTPLSSKPVGHVDTYTAYINGSNQALIDAADFLGMDAYPYYQTTQSNGIENARDLFFSAYDQTVAAGGGNKPVWVTETGWPASGKSSNLAIASVANARTYWQQVGCSLFGKTNVWWFTLADASNPSFGIVGDSINNIPLFDLSCKGVVVSSSSPSATKGASASKTTSAGSSPASASGSASTTSTSSSGSDSAGSSSAGLTSSSSSSSGSSTGGGSSASNSTGGAISGSNTGNGTSSGGGAAGTGAAGGPSSSAVPPTSDNVAANVKAELGSFAMAIFGALTFVL